jgi:arginine decarboxylase
LDQSQTPLVDRLQRCADRTTAPFHTPGHKKGGCVNPALVHLLDQPAFRADLPELPDLDNLFAPTGVIQAAQDLAAAAFGADRTWFLTNGSTGGILAAILATCGPGDPIILPRNIHLSAINGLILSGAVPVFLQPEYDSVRDMAHCVTPAAVAQALEHYPQAKAVMIVSPTYYGICADVAAIAQLAHHHQIPLLVDEAHGAHFAFHADLPTSALAAGADLVVQSTHKTLTALTQAAMVHTRGDRVSRDRLSQSLQLVQSTSPSYLLLASLDAARQQMATQGQALMAHTLELAHWGRARLAQIPGLTVFTPDVTPGCVALDPTRLTVTVTGLGLDGFAADRILHEQWGVTAELPSLQHLTFIISPGNTRSDLERLVAGFTSLAPDSAPDSAEDAQNAAASSPPPQPPPSPSPLALPSCSSLSPRAAYFAPTEIVPMADAVQRISAELICPYPPGIPVLMPGERVTAAAIADLQAVLAAGGTVSGCSDPTCTHLRVVKST